MDFDFNQNIPQFYDYARENRDNWFFNPSTIHAEGTGLQRYFVRVLYQRAMSVFKYKIPKEINPYYFKWCLWMFGYIGVGRHKDYGIMAQWGTLQGRDLYYYPKKLLISNEALAPKGETFEWRIGEDCEVLNLNGTFCGIWDTVNLFADELAITLESWATNCKKAIDADFYGVSDSNQAKAMKKAVDLAHSGEMEIFIDKNLFRDDGSLNVATFQHTSQYIGTDLLDNFITLLHMFDTEIGIDNSNTQKRERLNNAEVYSNNEEVKSKIEMWLDDLQDTCEKLKKDHDIDLWIELRNKKDEEVVNNVELV